MDLTTAMFDTPVPTSTGHWVSAEITRVIELIREYSPNLEVYFIPQGERKPGDAAFCITERLQNGQEVVAFYVQTEEEMDLSVLQRIYLADQSKTNVGNRVERAEEAARKLRRKRYEDEMAEAHDKAHFLWRTNKNTVTMDGKKIRL